MAGISRRCRFPVIAVAVAVLGVPLAYPQRTSTPPGSSSSSSSSSSGTRSSDIFGPGSGKLEIPTQMSGRVLMEDGTPPPEQVIVEKVCGNGVPVPIARTDSKGGFVVGSTRDLNAVDARQSSSGGARIGSNSAAPSVVPAGCSVQARLAGYQSTAVTVISDKINDLGTIILRRMAGVEGTTSSVTTLKAPKDAQKAYEKAMKALEKKKVDEARPQLESATKIYPQYAVAWFELGSIYQGSGDQAQAQHAFEQAVSADPKYLKPYLKLAAIYNQQKKWRELADTTAAVIKLDPVDFPAAYVFSGLSNLNLGDAKAAEASLRQALKVDAAHNFPEAELMLGAILADQGNSKEAAEHLRSYVQLAPNAPNVAAVKQELARLEQSVATPPANTPAAPR
jgi:Tfp pilus assembly protein PilF